MARVIYLDRGLVGREVVCMGRFTDIVENGLGFEEVAPEIGQVYVVRAYRFIGNGHFIKLEGFELAYETKSFILLPTSFQVMQMYNRDSVNIEEIII